MRTYTEVMDDSTGYKEVIRIEDDGVLVEDVPKSAADREVIGMLDASLDHLRSAERAYHTAEAAHQKALYLLTQNVWRKRGPNA